MKKILTAIALTIALPAMAHAQTAPAPAPKADCCEKMKNMADCKDMAMMDHSKMDHSGHDMKAGANLHAGHDMPQPDAKAPQADAHQNHQN